jgi:transglutaminase-like putative cysteine protease
MRGRPCPAFLLPGVLAGCILAGCVTNPVTPENYQAGTPPPVLGPLLTIGIAGVPQLINGEYGEAALYAGLFVGGMIAVFTGGNNAVVTTAGTISAIAGSGATIVDDIITTNARSRQYTEIKTALEHLDEMVSIPDIATERLFSALYRRYQTEPVATVTLDNVSAFPISDVAVSLSVPNLLQVDAETRLDGPVEPHGRRVVKLTVSLSPSILDLTETTHFEGTVTVSYRALAVPSSVTHPVSFEVLHRNAMTWEDDQKLGNFVTPNDSAVRIFARSVAVYAQKHADGVLPPRLQTAAALYAALGEYGIVYVIDPATPFIEYRASKIAVDYIEYPVDTLKSRTGDCDDLVSLSSALLESAGIPVMLVTGPGHIFLAFDTGMPASEMDKTWRFPQTVFEHGGTVWVPVEATLVGGSFLDSWRAAADEFHAWTEHGVIALHPVREAWKLYPPTAVPDQGWDPVPPAESVLSSRLGQEFVQLRSMVK